MSIITDKSFPHRKTYLILMFIQTAERRSIAGDVCEALIQFYAFFDALYYIILSCKVIQNKIFIKTFHFNNW